MEAGAVVPTSWRIRQPRSGASRIPFVQRCQLVGPGGERAALICDLSAVGLYVRIDPAPPQGALFQVLFRLFPSDERPMRAHAVVAWQNPAGVPRVRDLPPGCGLRFLDLPATDAERVEALVRAYKCCFPAV
jgi:hypothetical protein